jgi:hypothetical protein
MADTGPDDYGEWFRALYSKKHVTLHPEDIAGIYLAQSRMATLAYRFAGLFGQLGVLDKPAFDEITGEVDGIIDDNDRWFSILALRDEQK